MPFLSVSCKTTKIESLKVLNIPLWCILIKLPVKATFHSNLGFLHATTFYLQYVSDAYDKLKPLWQTRWLLQISSNTHLTQLHTSVPYSCHTLQLMAMILTKLKLRYTAMRRNFLFSGPWDFYMIHFAFKFKMISHDEYIYSTEWV
jgi:hypothetical protein